MSLLNSRFTSFLPKAIKPSALPIFRTPSIATSNISPLSQLPTTNHYNIPNSRPFSQSANNMSPAVRMTGHADAFLDTMASRRTIYALDKSSPIPQSRIEEIIHYAIKHVPSSFNSQTTRIILLVGEEHDKLWEIVKESVKAVAPADAWPNSEKKLNGFKAGYGTILFFDDTTTVKAMQSKFAIYASKFPEWAQESTAMHQYAIWCALEAEGLGANLQHYNPIIDTRVAKQWNVPEAWALRAQMIIGGRAGEAGEKTFKPVEERFLVHGSA